MSIFASASLGCDSRPLGGGGTRPVDGGGTNPFSGGGTRPVDGGAGGSTGAGGTSGPAPTAEVWQIAAGHYHTCARMADATVRCWGENSGGKIGDGRR